MKVQVNLETENAILAQNIAKKISALAERFETVQDFDRFLSTAPDFMGNFLVKKALTDKNIKLKTQP